MSCSTATAIRCEVRRACRALKPRTCSTPASRGALPASTSTPASALFASDAAGRRPIVAPRLSPARRGRRAVTAASSESDAKSGCNRDLLCVGPGVLGSLICQRWLNYFPASVVIGQTNTDNAHDRLVSLGIMPRLKRDAGEEKFSFVVFSAPPSGSEDYTAEVEAALKLWDGTGAFVFTSSTAVYDAADGEPCDETTPQFKIGESPRADRLLKAEEAVLGAGGCVVRLAGLYHSQRGAHMYFLKTPTLASRPDALVNLVHYEDAASACVAALMAQFEGRTEGGEIFLATDSAPVTRQQMVESCLECEAYSEGSMPEFSVSDGPLGKSMTNPQTRAKLGWEPVHKTFTEFVAAGATDSFYPKKKVNRWR